jgi:hypothetical protein
MLIAVLPAAADVISWYPTATVAVVAVSAEPAVEA